VNRFFITGMPNTPLAWLAVLCTTDQVLCRHSPTPVLASIDDLKSLYEPGAYRHVGIADSALGFFAERILREYHPRTVVVYREPREVDDEIAAKGVKATNYNDLLAEALERIHKAPSVMWVPCQALRQKRVIQKIFWHLLPGVAFDEARFDMLWSLMIQVDPEKSATFEANAATIRNLMAPIISQMHFKEPEPA